MNTFNREDIIERLINTIENLGKTVSKTHNYLLLSIDDDFKICFQNMSRTPNSITISYQGYIAFHFNNGIIFNNEGRYVRDLFRMLIDKYIFDPDTIDNIPLKYEEYLLEII